ncbi:high nitrogen upregulated cytochrome P450 monooxygenase 2 [Cubamyces sp. BRFM 1775]|nr:high nitrogen upregulated cytochrome P450 monooxygenase 2 [Cubamyces sp. BRFM 1775]
MPPAPLLAVSDVLLGAVASGLTAHQIFKRFEPDSIPIHLALLFLPPTIFTYLLHAHISLPTAIFASFGTYLTTLLLSIAVYRLSPWHPLARYPGPLYLRVSKLPLTWIASTGKQHKFVKKLHERYGDIVRTGPNELSIRNADAIPSVSTLPKGPRWINSKMAFSDQNSLIAESNPHEHARRRKPWNRAFNSSALKGYEEIIVKRANMLYEGLAAQKGAEVDLGKWIGYFSYDFMSDMAFGGGSEMLQNGDGGSNWHTLNDGMASFHVIGQIPWVVLYIRRIPSFARLIQRMVGQGVGLAIQRVKNGSLSRDLFYYLNNEDGAEPTAPPFRETVSNGTLAMIAGSDTTSIALSNLFYFVLSDPAVYTRLRAEVDHYFPPGENPLETKHHASMPFLNAVINETLRLIPVVPDGSQRRVPKGSGGRVAGPYYLPEGTITYVHFYSLHRDPKYFSPHPESFYPDRWLSSSSPSSPSSSIPAAPSSPTVVHTPSAFVPFSFGPANCVGRGLALQEMRMLVCLLVQRFDMRFPEGDAWDPRTYEAGLEDWFTIQKPALKVVLTPRQS